MSLRRGYYARLEATGWTVTTVSSPWQWQLAALVQRWWSR
jgi:hypothetical protein